MSYTILMDNSKYLTATTTTMLYQGENYCDTFQFLIPVEYDGHDLQQFIVAMQYTNAEGQCFMDILEPDEELYKEKYIRFPLPITTKLTKIPGEVKITLSLNHFDKLEGVQYTLHTSEISVQVNPIADYYTFSDDSLNKIDKLIGSLDAKIEYLADQAIILKTGVPTDLGVDENGTLKQSIKGELVGEGVDVLLPANPDINDGVADGIQDLDEIYKIVQI